MKYSPGFLRDFNFYFRMRKFFTFSGDYLRDKHGEVLVIAAQQTGVDARQAFHAYESTGKLKPTRHPLLLFAILKAKASANFHIKELYATDRAAFRLGRLELEEIYEQINPPEWFKQAVENWTVKLREQKQHLEFPKV